MPNFSLGVCLSQDITGDVPGDTPTTISPIAPIQLNFNESSADTNASKQARSSCVKDAAPEMQQPSMSKKGTEGVGDGTSTLEMAGINQRDLNAVVSMIRAEESGGAIPLLTAIMPESGDVHADKDSERVAKGLTDARTAAEGPSTPMETRTCDQHRAAPALLSPYNERPVNPTLKLSRNEKIFYVWVLTGSDPHVDNPVPVEIADDDVGSIFICNKFKMLWFDVETFCPDSYLSANAVNAWGSMLNVLENYRSQESPYRFYFSVYTTSHTVVKPPDGWNNGQIVDKFCDDLDEEIVRAKCVDFKAVDIVFFPVLADDHYYLVAFELRVNRISIIDNSNIFDDEDITTKYKNRPKDQVKLFNLYLVRKGHGRATSLNRIAIERLKMPWRNDINKNDCGIYCMKHMETYSGQKLKEWNSGLKQGSVRQMRFLRAKYVTRLLSSAYNELNADNIRFANDHWRIQGDCDMSCAEKFIMDYVTPVPAPQNS